MARGKSKWTNPDMHDETPGGVVRVKVLPEDDEHSASGAWGKFTKRLKSFFKEAANEDLAGSAVHAVKSKLDEQSYKNEHMAAQIGSQLAETRLRHSEADKSASFLHAERRLLDAQADKTEAEAAKIRAEAQSVNLENQFKLLREFRESGVELALVLDEDGSVIGVTVKGIDSEEERLDLPEETKLESAPRRSATVGQRARRKKVPIANVKLRPKSFREGPFHRILEVGFKKLSDKSGKQSSAAKKTETSRKKKKKGTKKH